MTGRAQMPAGLIVVGANHKSSTIVLRDRLFVDDAAAPAVLAALRQAGIEQAVLLSTCDRIEVQGVASAAAEPERAVARVLGERAGVGEEELAGQFYALEGEAAARHIFAVAASLDSQVIGEPQVLGQVKASHRIARAAGMVGPELEAALQAAYGVAKQVRSGTRIGERPVSMAAAAVEVARDVHGDLSGVAGLLIGDGEMGELIAEHLRTARLGRLTVTAPSPARAEALARRLDSHVAAFVTLAKVLPEADIVIASLGGRSPVLGADMMRAALKARRRRPVFLVDAAFPGDIDPAVERLEEAFLFSLDDLERVAMEGRMSREAAATEAWSILDRGLEAYLRGRAEREAVPAIAALRDHFEDVRREVLEAARGHDAEEVSRRLVNRLLHAPAEALKRLASEDGAATETRAAETLLRRLFGLGRQRDDDKGS